MIKNPNTGELFGECSKDKAGTRTDFCCDPNYTILPSINVHKNNNPEDKGIIEDMTPVQYIELINTVWIDIKLGNLMLKLKKVVLVVVAVAVSL